MRSMVELAAELTVDEELQKAIVLSSLAERKRTYATNKRIVGFCKSCWASLTQKARLCDECQALATKGWLPAIE